MVKKLNEFKSFYDNDNSQNQYITYKGFKFKYYPQIGDMVCLTGGEYKNDTNPLSDDSVIFYSDLGIGKIKDQYRKNGSSMYKVELENGDIVVLYEMNLCPYFG